jgi:hypothetical protein
VGGAGRCPLRTFARQGNLNIVDEFVEKQSVKIPDRPVFSKMMELF